MPHTEKLSHLGLINYLTVISGQHRAPVQTLGSWFGCNIKLKMCVLTVHIVVSYHLFHVNGLMSSETERCSCIYGKGIFYSALISCVGNIIYQIKHVPAGKLCPNYIKSQMTLQHDSDCTLMLNSFPISAAPFTQPPTPFKRETHTPPCAKSRCVR